jgi:L-malate glycosyltransferase
MDSKSIGKNFAGDELWNSLNNQVNIDVDQTLRSEFEFINTHIPPVNNAECLEIGSFPGSNLSALSKLGYTLNGIDISPRNKDELPHALKEKGYKIGEFWTDDIFEFKPGRKFDLVCSFGFIEHFENYLEVIKIHCDLVKYNGYVIITTPNYKGFLQYGVHYLFDKKNLKIHNVKSMSPKIWADYLQANNFEIIFKGYFGGLYFWLGNHGRNKLEKFLIYILHGTAARLKKIISSNSSLYSYNCGIVAKKKFENHPLP